MESNEINGGMKRMNIFLISKKMDVKIMRIELNSDWKTEYIYIYIYIYI